MLGDETTRAGGASENEIGVTREGASEKENSSNAESVGVRTAREEGANEGSVKGRPGQIALRRHMQQRLLGFVVARIYEAQDFLGNTCYQDKRNVITEERKRRVVRALTRSL